MIIVKLNKVVSEDKFYGIPIYNKLFMKLKGSYYAPIFYNKTLIEVLINSSYALKEFYNKFYNQYTSLNIHNTIEDVVVEDKLIGGNISEYLIYKILFGLNNKKFYPKRPTKLFKLVEKYTTGIDPLWWLVQSIIRNNLIFYGGVNNTIITSEEIILSNPETSIKHLEKLFDKLYFKDFNLEADYSRNILKYGDVYFTHPFKITDNTIMSLVFPYLYVRGQLDENTAIVNKYKFTLDGDGYFELVRSEIVNDSLKFNSNIMDKETIIKDFPNVEKLKRSIESLKSKGYLRSPALPLYHNGYIYLFLNLANFIDLVLKTKANNIEVNIDKEYFKQKSGKEIKILVDNQVVKTFYKQHLFTILNPACKDDFNGERVSCVLHPHPLKVKGRTH